MRETGSGGIRTNPSGFVLAAAIILAFTVAAGGLSPNHRAFVLGLILAAALMSRPEWRIALWGPALAAGISLAFAPIPGLGWEPLFQLVFFAAAGSLLGGSLDRQPVPEALLLGGVALAFSVIAEAAGHVALLGRDGFGLGAAGFLLGANVSAVALAAVLPAGAHGAVSDSAGGSPRRFLSIAAAVVILSAIVLTGSRTGLIAAAAGLVPFALTLPARTRRAFIAGFVLVCGIGAFLYLPRFLAKLDPAFITNAQRLSMIHGVLEAVSERPLAGFGPGAFPILGQRFLTWPKWELHPHSLPLRVLFESGVLGIAGWGWLAVAGIRRVRRNLGPGGGDACPISLSVACALAAGSITDDVLWIPGLGALFFVAVGGLLEARPSVRAPGRAIGLAVVVVSGLAAALLPAVEKRIPGFGIEPNFRAIDRAVLSHVEPTYRGWQDDPMALRVGAYARWARGDSAGALQLVDRALALDPRMIFGPHLLDRAWMDEAMGDTDSARRSIERARAIAPVLTARYCGGESEARERSWIDRHYGIEFPDASTITAKTMTRVADPLDWRHARYEAMAAWERGDTPAAREFLERSSALAAMQYGRDPVLLRLNGILESDPLKASEYMAASATRSAPAYPYRVFAPLVYRKTPMSSGENSPWWLSRMGWEPRPTCP